ncbi:unnamed protein product [Calicophoron daubneyi]|uniref:Uncharacterized protein n=1 Tax=Calicophoron daubneyi TaxID=300641 RepID=A0AAV2TIV9_CALDB
MEVTPEQSITKAVDSVIDSIKRQDSHKLFDTLREKFIDDELLNSLDPSSCLTYLQPYLPYLEEVAQKNSNAYGMSPMQTVKDFLRSVLCKASEKEDSECPIEKAIDAVNGALNQSNPVLTICALRPFLREATLSSLEEHKKKGSYELIASLYHIELGAAKADKGSSLTDEELIAASDVLACVCALNEAVDNMDASAMYEALRMPDAYWDDVVCGGSREEQLDWARQCLNCLSEVRKQKFSMGYIPILTHAEIQTVVTDLKKNLVHRACAKEQPPPPSEVPEITLRESDTAIELSESAPRYDKVTKQRECEELRAEVSSKINRLVTNLVRNCPTTTFECLKLLDNCCLMQFRNLDLRYADLYHAFLFFTWHRWLSQFSPDQLLLSSELTFPNERILLAIKRSHDLARRIEELALALTNLNDSIDRSDRFRIGECLKCPSLELERYSTPLVHFRGPVDRWNKPVSVIGRNMRGYIDSLLKVRCTRMKRYMKIPGMDSMANQPDCYIGKINAHFRKICSYDVGSGWFWAYVTAVQSEPNIPSGNPEEQSLSRLMVPFFCNVQTKEIIRWPITASSTSVNSVWMDNLLDSRWPLGTGEPPALDPSLLNRDDIISVISKINDGAGYGDQSFADESKDLGLQNKISAGKINLTGDLRLIGQGETFEAPDEIDPKGSFDQFSTPLKILKGVIHFQAIWRGYRQRKRYAARIKFIHSREVQAAVLCLQKNWRRVLAQRRVLVIISERRQLIECVVRIQALWRGILRRRLYERLLTTACGEDQCDEYDHFSQVCEGKKSKQYGVYFSHLNAVMNYVPCLEGKAAQISYRKQITCLQICKHIMEGLNKIREVSKELFNSDQLIKLLVKVRLNGKGQLPRNELSSPTVGSKQLISASKLLLPSSMTKLYSHICYLLYTQPDYLASLLMELPNAILWQSTIMPKSSGFSHFRPNIYGLTIERLVFAMFHYGKSPGDECRLNHLFSRCFHKEVSTLRTLEEQQLWINEKQPWPLVLRLTVSFARMKMYAISKPHSQPDREVELILHSERLKSLLSALIEEIQRPDRLESPDEPPERPRRSRSLMHSTRSNRASSRLSTHNTPKSMTGDVKSRCKSPRNGQTKIQRLLSAADDFFRGLFVDPGPAALPHCLKYAMRELYMAMRNKFSDEPEKNTLKFVGHSLLHRYFNSTIIAPDVYEQLLKAEEDGQLEVDEFSLRVSDDVSSDSGSESGRRSSRSLWGRRETNEKVKQNALNISAKQRRTLTAISRILYFVIANKGYGPSEQPRKPDKIDLPSLLNPCIRVWHSQFRAYMSKIVNDSANGPTRSAGTYDECPIATWVNSLPESGAKDADSKSTKEGLDCPTPITPDSLVLTAGELFELHRILLTYQERIAPNPSDPLNKLLQLLGPVPQNTKVEQAFKHSNSDHRCKSADLWKKKGSLGSKHSLRTESSNSAVDQISARSSRNSTPEIVTPLSRPMRAAHSMQSLPKIYSRKIQSCYQIKWPGDCGDRIVYGSEEITIPLAQATKKELIQALFYSASGALLKSTDCLLFPQHPCHRNWPQKTNESHCAICKAEEKNWNQFVYGSLFQDIRSENHVKKISEDSKQSDDSSCEIPEASTGLLTASKNDTVEWIHSKFLLVDLVKNIHDLASRGEVGSLPPGPQTCSSLRTWLKRLDLWLLNGMKNNDLTWKISQQGDSRDVRLPHRTRTPLNNERMVKGRLAGLRHTLNKLRRVIKSLCTMGALRESNGYQDLVVSLARDICHLHSDCFQMKWDRLQCNLQKILDQVELENKSLDQQAVVYAAHALDCLVPLERPSCSSREHLWGGRNRNQSDYRVKFSANRVKKYGLVYTEPANSSKLQNTIQLCLEPISDSKKDASESGKKYFPTVRPRFIPGAFRLGVEISGVVVHQTNLNLVDLLCQRQRGAVTIPVLPNVCINLDQLIAVLLDEYYTKH